jgi:SAM-dependent methyltransferase
MGQRPSFNYDDVYDGRLLPGQRAPWDIGEPQLVFVGLTDSGRIHGRVLDAGCGTGEHALFFAERGHESIGIDRAAGAIRQAREKAGARGLLVSFHVGDCTELDDDFRGNFDTVVDCGLFHSLSDEDRVAYAGALHKATREGATVYILSFSQEGRKRAWAGVSGHRLPDAVVAQFPAVTDEQLRQAFAAGWETSSIEESSYAVRFPGSDQAVGLPAVLASFERT